jgi:uracil-DNA glycosylase
MDVQQEEILTCEHDIIATAKITYDDLPNLFVGMIPVGWNQLLNDYTDDIRTAGEALARKLKREKKMLVPHPWNVFRAFQLTPWWDVKVVIIGQDPYYLLEGGQPVATGCSFDNWSNMGIQHSLRVIFKRLESTIPGFTTPKDGNLTKWMQQGVLMMNAALTTEAGEKAVHMNIWQFFPLRVLQYLCKKKKNIVFMAWGKEAQAFLKYVEGQHLQLQASHPAARGNYNTFNSCDHFNDCNRYLQQHGIEPIDWHL